MCTAHFNAWKVGQPSLPQAPGFLRTTEAQQSSTSTTNQALVPAQFNEHLVYATQGEGPLTTLFLCKQSEAPKVTGPIPWAERNQSHALSPGSLQL